MKSISVALAAAITFVASVVGMPTALAADGPCPTASGITVIVDASDLDAGIVQRCAEGESESGFDALVRAGFQWSPVSNSPALLCRIEGLPGTDRESCADAPPLNAYWAYFRAERGGSWQYSQTGAQTKPTAGTVIGWVFLSGSNRVPALAPPAKLPDPKPTPKPTSTPTKAPVSPRPTQTKPAQERPAPQVADSPSDESLPAPGVVPNAAKPAATQAGDAAIGPPTRITLGAPPSDSPPSEGNGSLLSFIIGIGTALALLGAATVMEIRRRRRPS